VSRPVPGGGSNGPRGVSGAAAWKRPSNARQRLLLPRGGANSAGGGGLLLRLSASGRHADPTPQARRRHLTEKRLETRPGAVLRGGNGTLRRSRRGPLYARCARCTDGPFKRPPQTAPGDPAFVSFRSDARAGDGPELDPEHGPKTLETTRGAVPGERSREPSTASPRPRGPGRSGPHKRGTGRRASHTGGEGSQPRIETGRRRSAQKYV